MSLNTTNEQRLQVSVRSGRAPWHHHEGDFAVTDTTDGAKLYGRYEYSWQDALHMAPDQTLKFGVSDQNADTYEHPELAIRLRERAEITSETVTRFSTHSREEIVAGITREFVGKLCEYKDALNGVNLPKGNPPVRLV